MGVEEKLRTIETATGFQAFEKGMRTEGIKDLRRSETAIVFSRDLGYRIESTWSFWFDK